MSIWCPFHISGQREHQKKGFFPEQGILLLVQCPHIESCCCSADGFRCCPASPALSQMAGLAQSGGCSSCAERALAALLSCSVPCIRGSWCCSGSAWLSGCPSDPWPGWQLCCSWNPVAPGEKQCGEQGCRRESERGFRAVTGPVCSYPCALPFPSSVLYQLKSSQ